MMTPASLIRPGDIFVVRGEGFVSRAIIQVCKRYALDGKADYSHAGIITSARGDTFESLRRIQCGHIDAYRGKDIFIGRPVDVTMEQFQDAIATLYRKYDGIVYPTWRIALHYLRLAQWVGTGDYLVCSELVAAYLKELRIVNTILGYNPDHIHDMIVHWRTLTPIFRGKWEPEVHLPPYYPTLLIKETQR